MTGVPHRDPDGLPVSGAGGETCAPSAMPPTGPLSFPGWGAPPDGPPGALARAYQRAAELILGARCVALGCHEQPDGDAVGSLLALALTLDRLGIERLAYVPDPVPDNLLFLPTLDSLRPSEPLPAHVDLFIAVDVNEVARLGSLAAANPDLLRLPIVNLDHHVTNTGFGTANVVDSGAASTCEMVHRLLPLLGVPLDLDIGMAIGTGLLTDTLGFRTSNTRPSTLRVGADLLERGVPLPHLADLVFRQRKVSTLRLWGMALAGMEARDGIVWAAVTREMFAAAGALPQETDGLIELLSGVRNLRAAALFKEDPDGTVRVSLRSAAGIDVAAIAVALGGGGHARAAGATVGGDLEAAKRRVLDLLFAA